MRKLFFTLLMCSSVLSKAQTVDSSARLDIQSLKADLVKAGSEIKHYKTLQITGAGLTIAGAGFALLAASENDGDMALLGGGLSLIGFVMSQIAAPIHIGRVGLIFNKQGIGIPLKNKR